MEDCKRDITIPCNATNFACEYGLTPHGDFMSTNACAIDVNEHYIFHTVNISFASILLLFALFYIKSQRKCMAQLKKSQMQHVAARFSGDMNQKKLYYYYNCSISFICFQVYSICCLYKFQQCDEFIIIIMIFLNTTVVGGLWIATSGVCYKGGVVAYLHIL